MKIKTSELTGAALDWAVAKCEGIPTAEFITLHSLPVSEVAWKYQHSTNWAQGGPIIDAMMKDGLTLSHGGPDSGNTRWWAKGEGSPGLYSGPTALIAAMRCYVASKMGVFADVPKELTK